METPLSAGNREAGARSETLFFEALRMPAGERGAFLDAECGADPGLRAEVEALLRDHEQAGSFLDGNGAAFSPELEAELHRQQPERVGGQIGPYRLLEQIGEGSYGTVWVA